MNLYTSFAKDIHKLYKNKKKPLILGGLVFDNKYKIKAHSDGDIILHAISNAIFNLVGNNDIGELFPDTSLNFKNISSEIILTKALSLLKKLNYEINNINLTIVCNHINISSIKNQLLTNLKKMINIEKISLCGTRFEKPSNMIECYCIILGSKLE